MMIRGLLLVVLAALSLGPRASAIEIDPYIDRRPSPVVDAPAGPAPVAEGLARHVEEFLDAEPLAPLYVCAGIGGTDLFFDDSAEAVHALCTALPYLPDDLAERVKRFLAAEVAARPPWTPACYYVPDEGKRRELFIVPEAELERARSGLQPHLLGNLYATWLYAETCGGWDVVDANWQPILAVFRDFVQSGWALDPDKGDLYMNRYLAGLIGFARIAERHDAETAQEARGLAQTVAGRIVEHVRRSAGLLRLREVDGVRQIDAFIGQGDPVFLQVSGHRSKIAKFLDLTPEAAAILRDHAGDETRKLLQYVDLVMPGWYLVGEERQVHYGENLMDFPDFSLGIFQAKALIAEEGFAELARFSDMPWCAGDMSYIEKLALCLGAPRK